MFRVFLQPNTITGSLGADEINVVGTSLSSNTETAINAGVGNDTINLISGSDFSGFSGSAINNISCGSGTSDTVNLNSNTDFTINSDCETQNP